MGLPLRSPGICRAVRGARRRTRLRVVIGELDAFVGDPVDVGGGVTHGAHAIGADVLPADVITKDDQNVRFIRLCHGTGGEDHAHCCRYFSQFHVVVPSRFKRNLIISRTASTFITQQHIESGTSRYCAHVNKDTACPAYYADTD